MISDSATIHPSSVISKGAVIGDMTHIGPFCCIGESVEIGSGSRIESHAVIQGHTKIGKNCSIYPFTSLGMQPQDLKYKNEKSRLEIGDRTVIRENVTASIGTMGGGMLTRIGDDCLIMAYCHIAHDCLIGNNVILVNGANLSGHVTVGDHAIVGGKSAIKQFVRIGKYAMIGGFTGVDRDIIPYSLARGKRTTTLRGLNIIGLKRQGFTIEVISEILAAYSELFEASGEGSILADKATYVGAKYRTNRQIQDIIEFITATSKNPLCTPEYDDDRAGFF